MFASSTNSIGTELKLCLVLVAQMTMLAAQPLVFAGSTVIENYAKGPRASVSSANEMHENIQKTKGTVTVLECLQRITNTPRHDVDLGNTTIVLKDLHGKPLKSQELAEVWECRAFNKAKSRYVLISKNEYGITITLRDLVYLNEQDSQFQDSIFSKKHYEAKSAVMSPGGRYMAFIGKNGNSTHSALFVLDTVSDTIRRLGKAPSPPPDQYAAENSNTVYNWDNIETGYTSIEPAILSFTGEHTLRATYGADCVVRRAKKRLTRVWNVSFATGKK